MARDFGTGGHTNRLDSGESTLYDGLSAITFGLWCYRTNDSSAYYDMSMTKRGTNDSTLSFSLVIGGWGGAGADLNVPYCAVGVSGTNYGAGYDTAANIPPPSVNTWYHHCCTWSPNTVTNYVNGVVSGPTGATSGSAVTTSSETLLIGCNNVSGSYGGGFPGHLAEVAIWNEALTADEVAALGKGISPQLIRPQSLLSYWPIIGRNDPEQDFRSGKSATLSGTASVSDHPRIYCASKRTLFGPTTPLFYNQEGYRFRDDDGNESSATWLNTQDANIARDKETPTRIRILTDTISESPSETLKLQYRKVGDTEWEDIV